MKGIRLFLEGHGVDDAGGQRRGRVAVAEHLDVTAERDGADLPARAGPVVPAEQLGAKADREDLDLNAVAAGDEVVAELVHKDEDGQYDDKGDEIAQPAA